MENVDNTVRPCRIHSLVSKHIYILSIYSTDTTYYRTALLYLGAILSFVWRQGWIEVPNSFSLLGPVIAISVSGTVDVTFIVWVVVLLRGYGRYP